MRIFKVKAKPKQHPAPPVRSGGRVPERFRHKNDMALHMRRNPTPTEQIMAELLTDAKIQYKFQVVMLGYIPDFYIKLSKTILEVDGEIHLSRKEYDRTRDAAFVANGFNVFRVPSWRLTTEPELVMQELRNHISQWSVTKLIVKQLGRADRKHGRKRGKKGDRNKIERWQDVPKLNNNHLPR